MTDPHEALRRTFAAHEHLAPDTAEVYASVTAIARSRRNRVRVARVTGASVLGLGLVAGAAAPVLLSHTERRTLSGDPAADSAAGPGPAASSTAPSTPTPSPTPSPVYNQQEALNAYFGGGYDYNNAVELAQLWNEPIGNGTAIKVQAGTKLLEGQTLPVQPDGTPDTPTQRALGEYFAEGYDYNDAVTLAGIWHETDIAQVKIQAGQDLLEGQTLPIPPSGSPELAGAAETGGTGASTFRLPYPTPSTAAQRSADARLAKDRGVTLVTGRGTVTATHTSP